MTMMLRLIRILKVIGLMVALLPKTIMMVSSIDQQQARRRADLHHHIGRNFIRFLSDPRNGVISGRQPIQSFYHAYRTGYLPGPLQDSISNWRWGDGDSVSRAGHTTWTPGSHQNSFGQTGAG